MSPDILIINDYHDDNDKLVKLIFMLNPQYLGPLGYSSLGYTSINTVKSQNKKDEHNHLDNTQVSSLAVTITISHHHHDDKH